MHKIDKFLLKLDRKNRDLIELLIKKIKKEEIGDLDYKKLKGFNNIFRVRKRKFRIIYQKIKEEIKILVVDKKNDDIYKL